MDADKLKEIFKRNHTHSVAWDRYRKGMEYRRAGDSGLALSALSLGFWHNFGSADNYENMRDMVDVTLQHAAAYLPEGASSCAMEEMGQAQTKGVIDILPFRKSCRRSWTPYA